MPALDDFTEFYRAHERRIRATLFHLVRPDDLDDLVQQTFIRCWKNRDRFEGRSKVSTWAIRIAINLARDHWRGRRGEPAPQSLEDCGPLRADRDASGPALLENRQLVEKALATLSFEHRTVVTLMYYQDFTLEEIGELMDDAVGTVKSRLHYARKALRDALSRLGVEL